MSVQLDLLNRIVNVKWGGGLFVAAYQASGNNPNSKIYTSTKDNKWNETFSTPVGSAGFMVSVFPGCGVHGTIETETDTKEIFVLCGLSFADAPGPAMFLTSENGNDWSPQEQARQGEIYLVTWDEDAKTFYAAMHDTSELLDPASERRTFDVVLKSTDGTSWEEVSRAELDLTLHPIEPFCSDMITDRNGNRVPTSIFGYDKDKDILIAPDPINMTFGVTYHADEVNHGTELKIVRGERNETPGTETIELPEGMDRVWAVAFAGGIWQAVGEVGAFPAQGIIATSTDEGATWEKTFTEVEGSSFTSVAGNAAFLPSSG